MDASQKIRHAVSQVAKQRERCLEDPVLKQAVTAVKRFQARRFAATYADLLASEPYCQPARFFLDELYGARDFSLRDLQFARIAGALQRIFPREASATAVALAELHALSEQLDFSMGQTWSQLKVAPNTSDTARYVATWRAVDHRTARNAQLRAVLALGREIEKLTQTKGLGLMLKMMRGPAAAAGLGELQSFLESGFEKFWAMSKKKGLATEFLNIIERRESSWLQQLFDADPVACATKLEITLGQAR